MGFVPLIVIFQILFSLLNKQIGTNYFESFSARDLFRIYSKFCMSLFLFFKDLFGIWFERTVWCFRCLLPSCYSRIEPPNFIKYYISDLILFCYSICFFSSESLSSIFLVCYSRCLVSSCLYIYELTFVLIDWTVVLPSLLLNSIVHNSN